MYPLFWTQSKTLETLQQTPLQTYPLWMLYIQHINIFSITQNPLRTDTRSSRGLLFHRSSTVTFQACYQDNERWINTVEHHRTSIEWCHLVHIRQSCVYESVCAALLWTLWRGWDSCHRRSVLQNSPQFSCFHKTQHVWGKTSIDSFFYFFQKVYKGTTKNEEI